MSDNINFDYKNLSPFKWFVLENFPFIEADFDALTEWQLFCKIGKEMNKIIDSQNIVGEQAETLTNAFNNLKNYVDNYFNNLDVQDEINNKLNEMAQSGELQNIILNFISVQKVYNTFQELSIDDTLKVGMKVKTLGYYNINDGGAAEYIIENTVKEKSYQENILNNLFATLLIKNDTVNIHQFGAKGENGFDDTESLRKAIYYTNKPHTILFDAKTYYITNIFIDNEHSAITLKGQNSHYKHYDFDNATQIVPFVGMSGTMFSIGEKNVDVDKIAFGFTVKDICFSGNNVNSYQYNCFDFGYSSNVHFENVVFRRIGGNSLILNGCYDSLFDNVEFMNNGDKLSTNGEFSVIVKGVANNTGFITASNALRFNNCRWEGNAKDIRFYESYYQLMFNECKFEEFSNVSKIIIEDYGEIKFINCIFTNSGTEHLIKFENNSGRCETQFIGCQFTSSSNGLNGGKWINAKSVGNSGLIITNCNFNMPNYSGAIILGNYATISNCEIYSYSSDDITKIIECDYYCNINNIFAQFTGNDNITGTIIYLNNSYNDIKNINTNLNFNNIVNENTDNYLFAVSKSIVGKNSNSVNAMESEIFLVQSNTTIDEIVKSWIGCEIIFYSNGENVKIDFTNIPLVYNYKSSVTILPGRILKLQKVSTTQWVIVSENS